MTYELTSSDAPCGEHKDCTATTFGSTRGNVIGVRHLHQWLDKPGLDVGDDRGPDDLVFGAWNVGLLLDFDPDTGEGVFDPEASALTASSETPGIDPADRLNDVYPVADDHRAKKAGKFVKLVKPGHSIPVR